MRMIKFRRYGDKLILVMALKANIEIAYLTIIVSKISEFPFTHIALVVFVLSILFFKICFH
jgi:hypothetical protein